MLKPFCTEEKTALRDDSFATTGSFHNRIKAAGLLTDANGSRNELTRCIGRRRERSRPDRTGHKLKQLLVSPSVQQTRDDLRSFRLSERGFNRALILVAHWQHDRRTSDNESCSRLVVVRHFHQPQTGETHVRSLVTGGHTRVPPPFGARLFDARGC